MPAPIPRESSQPPIALIVRAGGRKPGSSILCFSSLRQTASRMTCSISPSVAPARSGSRGAVSGGGGKEGPPQPPPAGGGGGAPPPPTDQPPGVRQPPPPAAPGTPTTP